MSIKNHFSKLLVMLTFLLVLPFVSLAGGVDTTSPVFIKAIVDGDVVTLFFDEALDTGSSPDGSDFVFTENSSAVNVSSVNFSAKRVVLTMERVLSVGSSFLLDYNPGTNPIQDSAGNGVLGLRGVVVTDYDCGSIDVLRPGRSVEVGDKLYIISQALSQVEILDTKTKRTVGDPVHFGVAAYFGLLVGDYLYVADASQSAVFLIDTRDNTVGSSPLLVGSSPSNMILDGNVLYVLNSTGNSVSIVDVSDPSMPTVTDTISVGTTPISFVKNGNKLYVVNETDATVSVIDTVNKIVTSTISVESDPYYVTVVNNKAYVLNANSNTLSVIDTANDIVTVTISVGTRPIYASAAGNFLYVSNASSDSVSVVDTTSDMVIETVSAGIAPYYSRAVGDDIYISSSGGNTVTVINSNDNIGTSIPVSSNPNYLTLIGTELYVSHIGSVEKISVIDINKKTLVTCPVSATTYTCTYSAGTGGTISGDTNQTITDGASATSVEAIPDKGYVFEKWDDDVLDNPRTDTKVNNDISVTALFNQVVTYELNYLAGPGGMIDGSTSQTIEEGADGEEVTAIPDSGYVFEKWDDDVLDNPRVDKSVKSKLTVTASFVLEDQKGDGKAKKSKHTSGYYSSVSRVQTIQNTTNPTATTFSAQRTLKLGITGEDVKQLQHYLNLNKFPVTQSGLGSLNNETTKFGPMTKQAVIKFQLAHNLVGDGVVGPKTAALMK